MLCGVAIEVRDGEILVIIGSSVIGKSVLLKNIVELMKPGVGFIKKAGISFGYLFSVYMRSL
jgi:ABC-type transporter Mla maintaining outer membrane lipid asymmetry ATPase subunit MlaF